MKPQDEQTKQTAKQIARTGYKTRRCLKCGGVEYKGAFKWKCTNSKCGWPKNV